MWLPQVPVSPPGTPRESASKAFGHPQTDRTPFFGVSFRGHICGPWGWHWLRRGYAWLKAAPALAACVVLAGTADGVDKETAVSRAQLALDDYIKAVQGREPPRRGHR